MATTVYLLCAVTSAICAVLLLREYRRGRTRLLLWSSLCFCFLMISNILLVVDLAILPDIDLSLVRTAAAAAAIATMLFGLVWDSV